jgi:hypothetical protein
LPACLVFALLDGYGGILRCATAKDRRCRDPLSIDGQPLPLAAVYDRVAL